MAMRPVIFADGFAELLSSSVWVASLAFGSRCVASTMKSTASRDSSASVTSCIMRRSSCVAGLCTPGVSTRMTCAAGWPASPFGPLVFFFAGTSSTPRMRVRVVWGLCVTMASFCPSSAFSSVLFPALGRPMMETNPERRGIRLLSLAADAYLLPRTLISCRGRLSLAADAYLLPRTLISCRGRLSLAAGAYLLPQALISCRRRLSRVRARPSREQCACKDEEHRKEFQGVARLGVVERKQQRKA